MTVDVGSISKELLEEVDVDVSMEYVSELNNKVVTDNLRFPVDNWKESLSRIVDLKTLSVFDESSGVFRAVELIGKGLDFSKMLDIASKELIPVKTFMKMRTKISSASSRPETEPVALPMIKSSFKHHLTEVGALSLDRLESNILDRHMRWMGQNTEYVAPAVSFCQSSGSGKSKLSIETLRRHPGFYLVLRTTSQTGYPFDNPLSREFYNIISQYNDTAGNQSKISCESSTVGKILLFFARITVSYLRSVSRMSAELHLKENTPIPVAVSEAVKNHAEFFFENENLLSKFEILSYEEVKDTCRSLLGLPESNFITVEHLEAFLGKILTNPKVCCLNLAKQDEVTQNLYAEICLELLDKTQKFPFLFVLDEADLLSDLQFNQIGLSLNRTVSGFEVLRRALGYFPHISKFFFLTLGTKSDVIDLNPPVLDMSSRFQKGKVIPRPITLSSNASIFSKSFPITKLNPSYNLLKNPLMFKFLLTLGHGLWSSFPFGIVVDAAKRKLKNGSSDTKAYFLPVWMIRTGLSSNPLNIETKSLVANHMATLLDIDFQHDKKDEIKQLTVAYPSEPVLAIAARSLISDDNSNDDALFRILKEKSEAVAIDVGKISESFGGMMVLRAIDRAENHADQLTSKNYEEKVNEMNVMAPEFKDLWNLKNNLLESAATDSPCTNFSNYKVTTVRSMLGTLIGVDDSKSHLPGIPELILDGLVNASHFVRLSRDPDGFAYPNLNLKPKDLPVADGRIPDKSRNVIDRAILETGLLRQCGFSVPVNYYGCDFVIPVVLENNTLTFIAIQVKNSGANSTEDVLKMQERLHLVKCSSCLGDNNESGSGMKCDKCIDKESLQSIYANQVSVLISLDQSSPSKFNQSQSYNSKITSQKDKDILLGALNEKLPVAEIGKMLQSVAGKSDKFLSPIVQQTVPLSNSVALVKSLWYDNLVELAETTADASIKTFKSDGMVHRQYCIMTRGWKVFEPLYYLPSNGFQNAYDILSEEGIFKRTRKRGDPAIIRGVLYDTAPGYFQYADEIQMRRGQQDSNFDLIDSLEKKELKGFLNLPAANVKNDKK